MAKVKTTITIDPEKAAAAKALAGTASVSETIDVALAWYVRAARLRRDVAAYQANPPTADELAMVLAGSAGDLADDTDWEALYADEP